MISMKRKMKNMMKKKPGVHLNGNICNAEDENAATMDGNTEDATVYR